VIMDILASYTEGSVDDLTVWGELAEVLLQLGIQRARYLEICEDVKELWKANASAATVDWACEMVDTFLFYPCQDESARLDVFIAVVSRAHPFKRLLESGQCALLRILALDLKQAEWGTAFAEEQDTSEGHAAPFAALAGKMVVLYSLTERVTRRVKDVLEGLCPGIDVRLNTDRVGTTALKSLAREADIFVVNTASAKHAATDFISANRKASAVTLFHNARGTRSMLTLIEQHMMDQGTLAKRLRS